MCLYVDIVVINVLTVHATYIYMWHYVSIRVGVHRIQIRRSGRISGELGGSGSDPDPAGSSVSGSGSDLDPAGSDVGSGKYWPDLHNMI